MVFSMSDDLPEHLRRNFSKGSSWEDSEWRGSDYGNVKWRESDYEVEIVYEGDSVKIPKSGCFKTFQVLWTAVREQKNVYTVINMVYDLDTRNNSDPKARELDAFANPENHLIDEDREDFIEMIDSEEPLKTYSP